jgi:branched-chain amino acid aminotransferase
MAFLFYFDQMSLVSVDGKIVKETDVSISAANHSYRYGDGLFETMKLVNGRILFEKHHFDRLFSGCKVLKFKIPNHFAKKRIGEEIKHLCKKNKCEKLARVRFSVSRGNGGLYNCDDKFSYLIECLPLKQNEFNKNGLLVDIFPDAKKSIDSFSNLKSANYLPYVMGAVWAKENKLGDTLILNQYGHICDSTIANVFWVKDEKIFTPPLSEGCVAGVMRRKILETRPGISESILTENILLGADELFLTNVITGIRWVGQLRGKKYSNKIASKLFTELIQTISS